MNAVTTHERPVRVFLLDDHEIVRNGVRELIEGTDDLVVVGEASSCAEALERIPAMDPDVAVLDVRLEDGSGLDVCRALTTTAPRTRSLMLTSYDEELTDAAAEAGAAAFVLKQIRRNVLVDSIRQVAAGRRLLDAGPRRVEQAERTDVDPRVAALSPRHRQILELVADGLTNRQIAGELGLSEKTVKNNVSAILLALGVARRVEAAVICTQGRTLPTTGGTVRPL